MTGLYSDTTYNQLNTALDVDMSALVFDTCPDGTPTGTSFATDITLKKISLVQQADNVAHTTFPIAPSSFFDSSQTNLNIDATIAKSWVT